MRSSMFMAALGVACLLAAGCGEGDASLSVSWQLVRQDGAGPVGCDEAGLRELNVHVHNGPTMEDSTRSFLDWADCASGRIVTGPLEAGSFWVTLSFFEGDRVKVGGTAGPTTIGAGQHHTLPPIVLTVDSARPPAR